MQSDYSRLIKPQSMLNGGLITIYVGRDREEFQVLKCRLASYEYWRKYLDANLTEDSQTMHLPQERPDIWELFVHWLYRGSLKNICMDNEDIARIEVNQYIVLYTRAEQWAIPALQNKIMDKLCAWTTRSSDWPPCNLIHYTYEHTPRDSPLRSYFVDSVLSKSSLWDADGEDGGGAAELKSQLDHGNQDFVLECFEALIQSTPKSKLRAPDRKTGCTYHKHEDGEKCSK